MLVGGAERVGVMWESKNGIVLGKNKKIYFCLGIHNFLIQNIVVKPLKNVFKVGEFPTFSGVGFKAAGKKQTTEKKEKE